MPYIRDVFAAIRLKELASNPPPLRPKKGKRKLAIRRPKANRGK